MLEAPDNLRYLYIWNAVSRPQSRLLLHDDVMNISCSTVGGLAVIRKKLMFLYSLALEPSKLQHVLW